MKIALIFLLVGLGIYILNRIVFRLSIYNRITNLAYLLSQTEDIKVVELCLYEMRLLFMIMGWTTKETKLVDKKAEKKTSRLEVIDGGKVIDMKKEKDVLDSPE